MSDLRSKLTTAKGDYKSLKYPGDLMADIAAGLGDGAWQPAQRSPAGWRYVAIAATAVIGLSVLLNSGGGSPVQGPTGGAAASVQQNPVARWSGNGMNASQASIFGNSAASSAMTDASPREVIFTNKIPQVRQVTGPMVPIDPRTGLPLGGNESRLTDYTIPSR